MIHPFPEFPDLLIILCFKPFFREGKKNPMIIQEAVLKLFDNFLGLLFLFELDEPIAHGLADFVSGSTTTCWMRVSNFILQISYFWIES